MLNKKSTKTLHAQSILEYVLLVGIITVVLFAMSQMIKRGAQSLMRTAADELSVQNSSDQAFTNEQGYLDFSNTNATTNNQKWIVERTGIINYIVDEDQQMFTNSQTNMGFTNEEE